MRAHAGTLGYCWGGSGGEGSPPETPLASFSAGPSGGCGVREDGKRVCQVSARGPFEGIEVATYHSCALGTDRTLSCWGDLYPFDDIEPSGPSERFLHIDVGEETLCGIRAEDNRLICTNARGGWFDTPSLDTFLSVSTGNRHFCAVRSDRKLLCLGEQAGL